MLYNKAILVNTIVHLFAVNIQVTCSLGASLFLHQPTCCCLVKHGDQWVKFKVLQALHRPLQIFLPNTVCSVFSTVMWCYSVGWRTATSQPQKSFIGLKPTISSNSPLKILNYTTNYSHIYPVKMTSGHHVTPISSTNPVSYLIYEALIEWMMTVIIHSLKIWYSTYDHGVHKAMPFIHSAIAVHKQWPSLSFQIAVTLNMVMVSLSVLSPPTPPCTVLLGCDGLWSPFCHLVSFCLRLEMHGGLLPGVQDEWWWALSLACSFSPLVCDLNCETHPEWKTGN